MRTLTVELGERAYPLYVGHGLLNDGELLRRHVAGRQVLIVSNKTVARWYLTQVEQAFSDRQCDVVLLADGERYKNLRSWQKILDLLLEQKHLRSTTLLALGGGVVGDLTGFAAACYQRGVNFIQLPTTLLAQVDASIGGKTAVNHPLGKNMIGAFYQPRAVIMDVAALKTLPLREYRAGLAEVFKAALLEETDFWGWLERTLPAILEREPGVVEEMILRAAAVKLTWVAADERDVKGLRALVNLGHTFAHAIERCLNYQKWLHGEAVAVGLLLAADLSARLGWLSTSVVDRIECLLQQAGLPIAIPFELQWKQLLEAMTLDKKATDNGLRFILLKGIGKASVAESIDVQLVRETLMKRLSTGAHEPHAGV